MSMSKTDYKQTEIGEIPEDWSLEPFGEVAYNSKDIFNPKKDGRDEGSVYLGLEHLCEGGFAINGIGKSDEIQSNKFKFVSGDILFGKLRPYFKKVYSPKFDGVCSTDIWVLRAKQGIDQKFLYFLVGSDIFLNKAIESSEGTKMPRASWDFIANYKFPIPSLDEQQQIAYILSSLDDKIELNRKMNKTLEEIGKALFKRWFVDFEFPNEQGKPYKSSGGRMVDSELGEIPEGWKVGYLGDVVENFDSKRIPLSSREREKRKGNYRYYGATGVLDYVDDYLFDGIYLLVGEDGTVITDKETAVTQYVWGKFWVNNHAHVLSGKKGFSTEVLKLFFEVTNIASYITGAVQPKLNQSNLNSILIVIPQDQILEEFCNCIESLFVKYRQIHNEIEHLTAIRDALLPRLMSGRLRV